MKQRIAQLLLMMISVAAISRPAQAAISYVQGASSAPQASQSSVSATFTSAQNAGDLIVVIVGWKNFATLSSITDTKGNAYSLAIGPTANDFGHRQSIYYAKNIVAATAGSNSVTVILSGAVTNPDIKIAEYSGLDTVNPLDVVVGASGNSFTPNSGSVATINANDLLVAGDYSRFPTTAPGSGFTQRVSSPTNQNLLEDKIVTTTGSYTATATVGIQDNANWWVMQMAAFKAASGGGDTTPPTAPTNLVPTVISSAQINLSWVASTDNVAVTSYRIERCQGAGCSNFTPLGTSVTTTFNSTGLAGSTTYRYQVFALDAANNVSLASNIVSATTLSPPDTQPPTAPSNLQPIVVSSAQINLSWTASADNVGVTSYQIQRCQGAGCLNFTPSGTSTTTTFNNTGLTGSTTYRYQVVALDAANNISPASNIVSATTQAPPDTQPPTAPTGLSPTVISSSKINLTWGASTDNVGVTGYRVERCAGSSCTSFSQVGTPTVTSFSDTGLSPQTTYRYQVRATDAAGNLGLYTSIVNATTVSRTEITSYTYDARGRLTKVVRNGGVNSNVQSDYSYDKANNRKTQATSGSTQ